MTAARLAMATALQTQPDRDPAGGAKKIDNVFAVFMVKAQLKPLLFCGKPNCVVWKRHI